MSRPRSQWAGALALALLLLLSACGSDETGAGTGGDSATTAPAGAEAAAFPRTVQHAMGATEVPAEPQRVLTLDMSFVDAALTLGVPIQGYTLISASQDGLPEYFGEARDAYAAEAVPLGDLLSPNLEAIAAARPDLILTSKVRHEALYDELSQIAPTVMSESAGAGWKDNIRLTAEAVGREDQADQVIADYEARAAEIGAAVNEAAGDPTVSVVRMMDPIRLYQRGSFSGVVLDDAGIARPDNQQALDPFIKEISAEQFQEANADVIFYTVPPAAAELAEQQLVSSGLWNGLPAVAAGRAHQVPDETWMSAVGMFGAQAILDDLAETFDVEVAR